MRCVSMPAGSSCLMAHLRFFSIEPVLHDKMLAGLLSMRAHLAIDLTMIVDGIAPTEMKMMGITLYFLS